MKLKNTFFELIKTRWELLINLLVFTIFKIKHLYYSYYWDESEWYLPAVKQMYKHGLSLLPSSLDPEYSRGHPLLFHCLYSVWMHVFGKSRFAMHSFALIIALCLLWIVYEVCLKLFNTRVAIISVLLISTQVFYFVQASYVLPEILVALFILLSIYYYSLGKYLLTGLFLFAAFFTKESALVVGLTLGVDYVFRFYSKNKNYNNVKMLISLVIPAMLMGSFFILQKIAFGWYILPVHSDLIQLDKMRIFRELTYTINNFFTVEYRSIFYSIFLVLPIVATVAHKNLKYLLYFLLPFVLIVVQINLPIFVYNFGNHKYLAIVILSIGIMVYGMYYFKYFKNLASSRFTSVGFLFILLYLIYSNLSFITYRYLISCYIPIFIFTAVFLDFFIIKTSKYFIYPVLCLVALTTYMSFSNNKDTGVGDTSLESFHAMDVQDKAIGFLIENKLFDSSINALSIHLYDDLRDSKFGHIDDKEKFTALEWRKNLDKTHYFVLDNIDSFVYYNQIKNDSSLVKIFRSESGREWSEIYRRK